MEKTQLLTNGQVEQLEEAFRREFIMSHPGLMLNLSTLCHTVRALRVEARARNILLLELGGRGELLTKEHVNADALDGLVAVRNELGFTVPIEWKRRFLGLP